MDETNTDQEGRSCSRFGYLKKKMKKKKKKRVKKNKINIWKGRCLVQHLEQDRELIYEPMLRFGVRTNFQEGIFGV